MVGAVNGGQGKHPKIEALAGTSAALSRPGEDGVAHDPMLHFMQLKGQMGLPGVESDGTLRLDLPGHRDL